MLRSSTRPARLRPGSSKTCRKLRLLTCVVDLAGSRHASSAVQPSGSKTCSRRSGMTTISCCSTSLQDLPPDRSAAIKARMQISDEAVQSLYDALGPLARVAGCRRESAGPADRRRDHGSRAVVDRLQQVNDGDADADTTLLTGIDDNYHGLCVGPCDPETAAAEASKCRLRLRDRCDRRRGFRVLVPGVGRALSRRCPPCGR